MALAGIPTLPLPLQRRAHQSLPVALNPSHDRYDAVSRQSELEASFGSLTQSNLTSLCSYSGRVGSNSDAWNEEKGLEMRGLNGERLPVEETRRSRERKRN